MENLKVIENELVSVYETSTGEKVVYGTELHAVLEVKSNYRDWIKNRINDCEALENEDYESFAKKLAKGGRPQIDHIIKLDTAKEMAMLERNEKGKQVRRYFIEVEKRYKSQTFGPTCIEDIMIRSLQEMKDIRAKVDQQGEAIQTVKQAMAEKPKENFSAWVAESISSIANSADFEENPFRYQTVWSESYNRLSDKAGCRLDTLLKNAKKRAAENGASKSKVNAISKLSVIAGDKRLKELYITCIREMMIAHCVA